MTESILTEVSDFNRLLPAKSGAHCWKRGRHANALCTTPYIFLIYNTLCDKKICVYLSLCTYETAMRLMWASVSCEVEIHVGDPIIMTRINQLVHTYIELKSVNLYSR